MSTTTTAPLVLRGTAVTHVGRVRETNEDRYGLFEAAGIACVADGMGGHAAGEVASRIAGECIEAAARAFAAGRPSEGEGLFLFAADRAHERMLKYQRRRRRAWGLGTTLTAVRLLEGERRLEILHVGDSRAYLYREGALVPLTRDHSVVGEEVEAGRMTREEARVHPRSHVLTRCLGGGFGDPPEPDVLTVAVHRGDRLLLCTDGLSDMVPEDRLEELFEATSDRAALAAALLREALEAGGRDNVTLVLADVE